MEILIAGHSVVDHIYRNRKEIVLPGGIYYSALGFSSISNENDRLFLLTSSGEEDYQLFKPIYKQLDLSYINDFGGLPHVTFFEDGKVKRSPDYSKYIARLNYEKIDNWKKLNGVYINMITGFEFDAGDFIDIRKKYKGKIYLDVHTLARALTVKNERYFRVIPDYERIIGSVNYVQVNEDELLTITPYDKLEKILETIFKLGVEILILTQGKKGVKVFTNEGLAFDFDAVKVESVNRLGCGDVFGSFFFYLLLEGNKIEDVIEKSNFAAALITTYCNTREFTRLRNDFFERYT